MYGTRRGGGGASAGTSDTQADHALPLDLYLFTFASSDKPKTNLVPTSTFKQTNQETNKTARNNGHSNYGAVAKEEE